MADIFVDSAAAGANNGTSWTDAYTSIASTTGAAAGDVIKVDDGHSEDPAGNTTWTWSNGTVTNPVRIICVDKTNSDALSTGATIGNTGNFTLLPQGNLYVRGINWRNGGGVTLGTTANYQVYETCTFTYLGTATISVNASRTAIVFLNTNFDFSSGGGTGVGINMNNGGSLLQFIGGTYTLRGAGQTTAFTANGIANVEIRGMTISGTCTNIFQVGNFAYDVRMVSCVLPTYTNLTTGTPDNESQRLVVERCAGGTITAPPLGLTAKYTRSGTIAETLSKRRTGGATDGEQANPVSWEMTTDSDSLEFTTPLASPWITRFIDSGASQTVTVYAATENIALSDDDLWFEILSPSESVSATAAPVYRSSRMAALGTPAALTADGDSTWTGFTSVTRFKHTFTISPTVAGVVQVRALLAKPSTAANIDPFLEVA